MSGTYYSENKLLTQLFGATSITGDVPTSWWLALSTTTPTESGTGLTEPSGSNYGRAELSNVPASFNTVSNGVIKNNVQVSFAESGSVAWGTITHIGLYDAQSGGNLWYWEALPTSRSVGTYTTVYFAALSLSLSNNNA